MSAAAARRNIADEIASLDLVLADAPQSQWRPLCERLARDLQQGRKWRTRIEFGGYAVLATLFVASEWRSLLALHWALLGTGAGTLLISAFTRGNAARSARGATFIAWALVIFLYVGHDNPLIGLLNLIPALALFSSELFFPALRHEERIAALLAYFGLNAIDQSEPADDH